ncbi:hypothetical protein GCM10008956_11710 [Deinococcus arenae]|uniref:MarR family transcriptional regulator n=1 Tax=Deinococcus arenae TaxID=1452751 RepID=A0A8H9GM64_9DEIO|nr:MarR family transcriptional regulator [Deinococcus arenae]AWT37579.1 MarR family transcriptional regulator [Deinococcus actinosclerus]GGM36886.1 hypothetical protein GCM10008956_11710 [Deinococcus arenae]
MSTSAEQRYIDDFALVYENAGLPRIAGRVLGYLMICTPHAQSAQQLATALNASRASISTMTRLLTTLELIERVAQRGRQPDLYRIREGAWTQLLQRRLTHLSPFTQLAENGLQLLEGAAPADRQRLEEMRDLYHFFEEEMAALIERLEARRSSAAQGRPA